MTGFLRSTVIAVVVAALGVAGCSSQLEETHGNSTWSPSTSRKGGERSLATPSVPAPAVPTAPAAATAGDLDLSVFPAAIAGFTTVVAAPGEGEFIPNGTPAHEVPSFNAAYEALPGCSPVAPGDFPLPKSALAAQYATNGTQPGQGLAMQFADSTSAEEYFDFYRDHLLACSGSPLALEEIGQGDHWLVGVRKYPNGESWLEVLVHTGSVVKIFVGLGGSADEAAASGLAVVLAGDGD